MRRDAVGSGSDNHMPKKTRLEETSPLTSHKVPEAEECPTSVPLAEHTALQDKLKQAEAKIKQLEARPTVPEWGHKVGWFACSSATRRRMLASLLNIVLTLAYVNGPCGPVRKTCISNPVQNPWHVQRGCFGYNHSRV